MGTILTNNAKEWLYIAINSDNEEMIIKILKVKLK